MLTHYIYFLLKIEILSLHKNLTETVHEVLQLGDSFGVLQGLFDEVPHQFFFRACNNVEVLKLSLDNWTYLLKFFPSCRKSIYNIANSLYNQI